MVAEDEANPRGEEVPAEVRERLVEAYAVGYTNYMQALSRMGRPEDLPDTIVHRGREVALRAFDARLKNELHHRTVSPLHRDGVVAIRDEVEFLDEARLAEIASQARESRMIRIAPHLQRYVAHCVDLADEEPGSNRPPERISANVREHAAKLLETTLEWGMVMGKTNDVDMSLVQSIVRRKSYEDIVELAVAIGGEQPSSKDAVIVKLEAENMRLQFDNAWQGAELERVHRDNVALQQDARQQMKDLGALNATVDQQRDDLAAKDARIRELERPSQEKPSGQGASVDPAAAAAEQLRRSGLTEAKDYPQGVQRPDDEGRMR